MVSAALEHSVCGQCPFRATETMDLVSLRHTLGSLFSFDVAALISACEKPASDDIHTCEGSILDNFAVFHGTYLCCVCLLAVFLSLTHASVSAVVLEHIDISIFLRSIIGVL